MPDLPLPVEFRKEIIQPALSILRSGESCALVGVGNSGKSNIARHLTRADVRLHYFRASVAQVFVLYLNCKPYASRAPHDLYLHALDQLERAIEELDGAFTALRPSVNSLRQEAQANPSALAIRNLDRAIDLVVRAGAEHIIFVLDDCDDLFARTPPSLFADLRQLRDNHKLRLVYMTLTRREPSYLRDNTPEYEELFELLSAGGHILTVTPYLEDDGFYMLRRLAARQDPPQQILDAEIRLLYNLAGGHGGLIRSLYFATRRDAGLLVPEGIDRLAANPDVQDECDKILNSLDEESNDLRRIILREGSSADGLRRLQTRGLIRPSLSGAPGIFSPVFETYLRRRYESAPERISIEFREDDWQVVVNGEVIRNLVGPEYDILRCMWEKRPQPCTITELIEAMLPGERGLPGSKAQGNPLQRFGKYMQELRAKIGHEAAQHIRQDGDRYWIES
jgi:hypothetical protein